MIDKGFIKEAIHCYVTAIRLMPKFSAAHSNLGSVFKEQGKLQQAIAHYQEAIKIDPSFADAFSNLGINSIHIYIYIYIYNTVHIFEYTVYKCSVFITLFTIFYIYF